MPETCRPCPADLTDAAARSRPEEPAVDEAGFDGAGWREVQRALAALGHDPGPVDGIPGRRTRRALAARQRARGLEPTGYLRPGDREAPVGR